MQYTQKNDQTRFQMCRDCEILHLHLINYPPPQERPLFHYRRVLFCWFQHYSVSLIIVKWYLSWQKMENNNKYLLILIIFLFLSTSNRETVQGFIFVVCWTILSVMRSNYQERESLDPINYFNSATFLFLAQNFDFQLHMSSHGLFFMFRDERWFFIFLVDILATIVSFLSPRDSGEGI